MDENIKIKIVNDNNTLMYAVHMIIKNDRGLDVAQPIMFKHEEKGPQYALQPCLQVENLSTFQGMFDDLWLLGLRPSARSDEYKAQLETMTDHLNDMRSIVFKGSRPDLKLKG